MGVGCVRALMMGGPENLRSFRLSTRVSQILLVGVEALVAESST